MLIVPKESKYLNINQYKSTDKEKIIRKCDNCELEDILDYRTVYQSRTKRNSTLDYCIVCVKKFSGINRRKKRLADSHGYIYSYDEKGNQILEQRKIVEKQIGRKLLEHEVVHHLDGNKINNLYNNLLLCENQKQHMMVHSTLEKCAFDLYNRNIIIFDKNTNSYYINSNRILELETSYGFEDIAIKQKKNICNSRLDVKIKSEIIKDVFLEIPLIASNMSTVVNSQFCIELYKLGALGILHRAAKDKDLINETTKISEKCKTVAVSIGVGLEQFSLAKKLVNAGANIICIDIAHGFSDSVIDIGKKLKNFYGKNIKLIVGNTTNVDMLESVKDFADAIKVGIAQGFACETANTAGCTEKQFSAVLKFKRLSKKLGIPIISDGAIREPADFTKSIAAGANSAMAGKIFAACPSSAAEIIHLENKPVKIYAGMASRYVQEQWKGGLKDGTCPEGGVRVLPLGEDVKNLLTRYSGALKSGITYGGGYDIPSFQETAEFIRLN